MTRQGLTECIAAIRGADRAVMDAARRRQAELAKPPGSLGRLEDYSVRMAGITGEVKPTLEKCRVLVLAADNGVVAEGVMSSLAHYFGDDVVVTDVGVNAEIKSPGVLARKVRYGTGNIARERAMSEEETLRAMAIGMELAAQAKRDGVGAVGIGEMGIGNTTTSSAVLAALTGAPVEALTGRGGGLTDSAFETKKRVIQQALDLHRPPQDDPVAVLSMVGGLDLAAMTGAFLGCAREGVAAVVDGFISVVAALCAARLCPAAKDMMFLSHASYEAGYRLAADELGLEPCLLLGMRLGEGSGCPLMFRVLQGACAVLRDMATFAEGEIQDDYLAPIRAMDAFTVENT